MFICIMFCLFCFFFLTKNQNLRMRQAAWGESKLKYVTEKAKESRARKGDRIEILKTISDRINRWEKAIEKETV